MNRALYTLILHLALPIIFLRLLWRAWRAPAYGRRIGERFAVGRLRDQAAPVQFIEDASTHDVDLPL